MFVVNLDDSHLPGSHWVAIKNNNGYSLCFDSYGIVPAAEVLNFADKDNFEVVYNTYRIQAFDSHYCGYFVVDFLESVYDYKSYHTFLLKYSPWNHRKNDKIVMKRLKLI